MFKTMLGKEIPESTRGILYLCQYTYAKEGKPATIEVGNELLYDNAGDALNAYANIRNTGSQLIQGRDLKELITNMIKLHKRLKDQKWINELGNYL